LSESRHQVDPDGSNSGGHHRLIPVETVEVGGGVLDCRWCPASFSSLFFSSPPSSPPSSSSPILACAVSTGCIVFYRLQVSGSEGSCGWEGNEERAEGTRLPRRTARLVRLGATSETLQPCSLSSFPSFPSSSSSSCSVDMRYFSYTTSGSCSSLSGCCW
jgi:hypothetical protein